MNSSMDRKFILWTVTMLLFQGYSVSSREACPVHVPHYCACEITDPAKSTLINMCSYEIKEGIGCKPCPPDLQDYANCTSCPGKTCPVCAPDELDMKALQGSVSLETFEDIKRIGHIATSFSFMFAQNSNVIPRTDEDQNTRLENATDNDQNNNKQKILEEKQTTLISNVTEKNANKNQLQFSVENINTNSSNDFLMTTEGQIRYKEQTLEEKQTTLISNVKEKDANKNELKLSEENVNTNSSNDFLMTTEDQIRYKGKTLDDETLENGKSTELIQKVSELESIEQHGNTTEQHSADEDKSYTDEYEQTNMDAMLNNSDVINSKVEFSGQRYASETIMLDVEMLEDNEGLISNVSERDANKNDVRFSVENLNTSSSNSFLVTTEEGRIRDEKQILDENQTLGNEKSTELIQKDSELEFTEQNGNTTDQHSTDDDKAYINEHEHKMLNKSESKAWFSEERIYPLEKNMPDVEMFEGKEEINESIPSLSDIAFRQPYLQTEMQNEALQGGKMHSPEDIKPRNTQSLLMETEKALDDYESTTSSLSNTEEPKYSKDSLVSDTVDGRTFNRHSEQPLYFLRGEDIQNDSLSDQTSVMGFEDEFQFRNASSKLGGNSSRNVLNEEGNIKLAKNESHFSHLTNQTSDQVIFGESSYFKDVISHDFLDENNTVIQTLAFDVIFVNDLKYSTAMPDLTTFYFIANYSLENKVEISLVRICFLNQISLTFTAHELNLCRKEILIPDSSFLLTVRIQNTHIFQEFQYEPFDDKEEHRDIDEGEHKIVDGEDRGENQTMSDVISLSTNERQRRSSKGYEYMLLRNGAKQFVHDSFNFRELYTLWETPQNDSSDAYRFCHDMNLLRVCKNNEDGLRIYLKFDERFHVLVSAFLDNVKLLDMNASDFMQMQFYNSYLRSYANNEFTRKAEEHENKQFISFPEKGFSNGEKYVDESVKTVENGSERSSLNATYDIEYDYGKERTSISYSDASAESDSYRNETYEKTNLSPSLDSMDSNFSEENDTHEDSLTNINGTTEEKSLKVNESEKTDDIQEYEYEDETRFRRASNSSEDSRDNWCIYNKRYFYGTVSCINWTYRKECTIECYPGYDYNGEKSMKFMCKRKENVWVPKLIPCLKNSELTNINVTLGLDANSDENSKSHNEAQHDKVDVSEEISTDLETLGDGLLSHYHASDFNFDDFAYDKHDYDSPSDEYE